MKIIYRNSIVLLAIGIILSCTIAPSQIEGFENKLGYKYPEKFKEYIHQLDDQSVNVINVLYDSFQVITPNNIDILDDQIFSKYRLVEQIDTYLSREFEGKNLKSLPFLEA